MTHDTDALASLAVRLDVVIRRATAHDIRMLEWGGEFWRLRKHFENAYAEQQAGRRLLLVADLNGYPVGRLFLQIARGNPVFADGSTRAYLYAFHVMKPLRGAGIGTALVDTAEDLLREHGFKWVTIAVEKTNEGALRLYQRLGYEVFREDPGRWSYTDPAGKTHHVEEPTWVMRKRLAAAD